MSDSPRFSRGNSVLLRSTLEFGQVQSEPVRDGGEYWYRVRFSRRTENVVEDDLDVFSDVHESIEGLATSGTWGRIQAFRTALAVERITHENRSTVYSYRSQRVLFEPHQYKPLLKLLDSPDRRLLIADEVGLGKTIEAGLILAEIEARHAIERVLVVCPSRLRDKWREEMRRKFDQPFDVMNKQGLTQYVSLVRQSQRPRQLRAIMSQQSLRSEEMRELLTAELGHIDVAIIDEAHHARNPQTQVSALLRELCEISDCVILLTATPLHLGSKDLFTLLQALRPVEFRDAVLFDFDLKRHAPVHDAAKLLRTEDTNALMEVRECLERVFVSDVAERLRNPLAIQVIEDLTRDKPTERRDWIELERRVQELHPLSSILTRTRKRDVQEHAPLRRPKTFRCAWTIEEDQAYQRLVAGSVRLGWIREKLSLGQLQRARQAASCLPAAIEARHLRAADSDDKSTESTDIPPSECEDADRKADAPPELDASWSGADSKYDRFREILAAIWDEEPKAKVLVFTFFVGTAKHLVRRLQAERIESLSISGDVPSNPLDPSRDERGQRIRQFSDDPRILVMVSTEVGSEGLDFQFCHHLVNYDLPWNPMVVEQRIGRIDRFGQKSPVVNIYNLVVEGTVEDRILERLYDRIGIFERSIGELDAILGEAMSDLRRDYMSGRLTPEESERRVEEAARAVEQRRLNLEQLEKNTGELFGHEEYIRDELKRIRRLGRFVSEEAMLAVINSFLESRHPDVRVWQERPSIYGCRMSEGLRRDVQDAARGGPVWIARNHDERFLFTMQGEVAFEQHDVELINVSHPLLSAAVAGVKGQLEAPSARVGQAALELSSEDEPTLPEGLAFIVVFVHIVEGIRERRLIETVAWSEGSQALLDAESSERLLHLVLEQGTEWASRRSAPAISNEIWNRLFSEARNRNRRLKEREIRENEALYIRRRTVLQAEYEHIRQAKEDRLRTAQARGHDRIVPAMRGQLEKAESEFRVKIGELDTMRTVGVRLSDPVAACVVEVRGANNRG